MKNTSLQVKISLAFILMTLLILVILGVVFYDNTMETLKDSKQKELTTIAGETANKIERFVFERSGDIKVLSESSILTTDEVSNQTKIGFLKNVMETYRTYDGIFVTDLEGKVTLSTGTIPDFSGIADKITGKEPFISELLINLNGDRILIFSRPIFNEKAEQIGAVAECMQLGSIEDIVSNVKIGETGFAGFEIEGNEGISYGFYEKTLSQKQLADYLTVALPVSNFKPNQSEWSVKVFQSKTEAYKVINDFLNYLLLVSVVIIVLFSFLSIVLSKIITEPIRRLMDKMNGLIRGNPESASAKDTRDEISSLTFSFDILLEQLNFLMQMVLEKTGEAAYTTEINENIRELFETIPNGILTIDAKGGISSVNKSAAQILGINTDDETGLSIYSQTNTDLQDFFKILAGSLENDRKYRGEILYIQDGHGAATPIIFNTLRQTDQNGELIGMTVIMNHLEEKRRLEESILRAKRLTELGEMAAGVAHEIRNPLASIKGYAQYARTNFTKDEQTYQDLSVILDEVSRLDLIVERFMGFALPKKPDKKWIPMEELIDETIKLMKSDFQKAKVSLRVISSAKRNLYIDSGQIKQVLINIMINGIQASKAGDEIVVRTTASEGENCFIIEIIDQGTGISDDQVDKIFTPFFTTKEKGSGLGLSISSRIIQNHGGTLEIDRTQRQGVNVLIKLPLKGD